MSSISNIDNHLEENPTDGDVRTADDVHVETAENTEHRVVLYQPIDFSEFPRRELKDEEARDFVEQFSQAADPNVVKAIHAVKKETALYEDVKGVNDGHFVREEVRIKPDGQRETYYRDHSDEVRNNQRTYASGNVLLKISSNSMEFLEASIATLLVNDEEFKEALEKAYKTKEWGEVLCIIGEKLGELYAFNLAKSIDEVWKISKTLTNLLKYYFRTYGYNLSYISPFICSALILLFDETFFKDFSDNISRFTIVFNSVVSFCFSMPFAIPIIAISCKANETWNNLRNSPKHITLTDKGKIILKEIIYIPISVINTFVVYPVKSFIIPHFQKGNAIAQSVPREPEPEPEPKRSIPIDIPDIFRCHFNQPGVILIDPVSLHGHIFERKNIESYLKDRTDTKGNKLREHPKTRKYATLSQIVTPPTEYMEALENFKKTNNL